jgi:Flp pilus assembly pilin Flp
VTAVIWPVIAAVIAIALLAAIVLLWRRVRALWLRLGGRRDAAPTSERPG